MAERKFRIAVLATVSDFGGAERVVLSLLQHASRQQFELVPIIFKTGALCHNKLLQYLDDGDLDYHEISADAYRCKYVNPFANLSRAYSLCKSQNFDLLHTHGYRADFVGLSLASLLGIPFVSTCHGFIHNDMKLRVYNRIDFFALRYAKKVFAVSSQIQKELIARGLKQSQIAVIENAIDVAGESGVVVQNRSKKRRLLNLDEKDCVVGYVGRLSKEKGVECLISGVAEAILSGMRIKLVIIGQGPLLEDLVALVEKHGIGSNVVFLGFKADVEEWFPMMDIFVLPSLSEGTPMALLEAMSFGIPSVASAVGGIPEILSENNGLLVSPGRADEIKKAIVELYHEEEMRKRISLQCRETILSRYSIHDWIKKVETEYLKVFQ